MGNAEPNRFTFSSRRTSLDAWHLVLQKSHWMIQVMGYAQEHFISRVWHDYWFLVCWLCSGLVRTGPGGAVTHLKEQLDPLERSHGGFWERSRDANSQEVLGYADCGLAHVLSDNRSSSRGIRHRRDHLETEMWWDVGSLPKSPWHRVSVSRCGESARLRTARTKHTARDNNKETKWTEMFLISVTAPPRFLPSQGTMEGGDV